MSSRPRGEQDPRVEEKRKEVSLAHEEAGEAGYGWSKDLFRSATGTKLTDQRDWLLKVKAFPLSI